MARVAIVTGGTRGIGAAISIMLKDKGMKVAANYAGNDERAKAFTERTGIQAYKWDVAEFDACQQGVGQVEADLGPVDVLVNNAGITRDTTMKRMDRDKWQQVIDTNLGGCFNMAKAVFEGMIGRGYGRIVNIGSINGQAGQYGQVNYAAAKSGIHGFTKALAQEGARAGVTVNAIAPGYIDTDMVAAVPEDVLAKIVARIPVNRLGRPKRSRAASLSWLTKTVASSPDRRCRSTAGSTCIDMTDAAESVGYGPPVKRSVLIAGHPTSISLEPVFWRALEVAAGAIGLPLNALVAQIDAARIEVQSPPNLTSAIRQWLFVRALDG